jgi:AraC-like DNA-binding protein
MVKNAACLLLSATAKVKKLAPYNTAAYECGLGHRSHFLQESIKSVSRKNKKTAR